MIMETSFFYRGKPYTFSHVTGIVVGNRETSETHISVSKNRIHTHIDRTQKIFIRDENTGQDKVVWVKDRPASVIEGHRVTAVAVESDRELAWVYLRNYNTSENSRLIDSMDFVRNFGSFLSSGCLSIIFFTVILSVAVFLVINHMNIPSSASWSGPLMLAKWGSGIPIFIFLAILNNRRLKKFDKTYRLALDSYLGKLDPA